MISNALLLCGIVSSADSQAKASTESLQFTQNSMNMADTGHDNLNLFFGSTLIGSQYQFTNKSMIQEGAEFIEKLGGNQFKFHFPTNSCKNRNVTLSDILDTEEIQNTFANTAIRTFTMWITSCANDTAKDYYDFSVKLLTKYNGSGKTFYLGAWEQDWWARPNSDPKADIDPKRIEFIINDANAKQSAIDKAKTQVNSDVKIHAYVEANKVIEAIKNQTNLFIATRVLPDVNVDFVSYSSYDSSIDVRKRPGTFIKALDFLQSKLNPREGVPNDARVILGEYGIPNPTNSPAGDMEQRDHAIAVLAHSIAWGIKETYFWQIYNNEMPNGKHRGFWLQKPDGTYTPLYNDIKAYLKTLKDWYAKEQKVTYGQNRRKAIDLLCELLKQPNCAKWRSIEEDSVVLK